MEQGDEAEAEEWLDPNHREGPGLVAEHERESLAQRVKVY